MIRWLEPVAARLAHLVVHRLGRDIRARPHMVEPAAAIRCRPVGRAVAPPGEAARRRGMKWRPRSTQSFAACSRPSASTSIGVWLTTSSNCLWLHTSHSSGAMLKSPSGSSARRAQADHWSCARRNRASGRILGSPRGSGRRRRRAHRHSPAARRPAAARRHAAPRHWPASRTGRPRPAARALMIATP
jgi:hypothetical protein